jgi:hypothetical protein
VHLNRVFPQASICRTSYAPSYRVYAINLAVPPKSDVLSWESSGGVFRTVPRAAVVWLRTPAATSVWEVIVSTGDDCAIVSRRQVQNVQPPMRGNSGEMANATVLVMSDPRVLTALAVRGMKPEEVVLDYDSVGNYPGDVGTSPREAIFEFYAAGGSNWYSRRTGHNGTVKVTNATIQRGRGAAADTSAHCRNRGGADMYRCCTQVRAVCTPIPHRYGRPVNVNARVDLDRWVVLSVFDGGLPGGVPPINGTEIDPAHVAPRAGAFAANSTGTCTFVRCPARGLCIGPRLPGLPRGTVPATGYRACWIFPACFPHKRFTRTPVDGPRVSTPKTISGADCRARPALQDRPTVGRFFRRLGVRSLVARLALSCMPFRQTHAPT